jgi:hypothetical protein
MRCGRENPFFVVNRGSEVRKVLDAKIREGRDQEECKGS